MLKGNVKVILTDVKTGQQQIQKHKNLVTKALDYIIPSWEGGNKQAANGIMPLATRALGGLMIFDGALTEAANNIYFPSEAHLVACAGQESDASNPRYGSKNNSESGRTSSGYQTTWDFGTSQANGTIKSLALTLYQSNGDTGCRPFEGYWYTQTLHNIRNVNGDRATSVYPLHYVRSTQEMYFIGSDGYSRTSVYDSNRRIYIYTFTMTIYKEYMPVNKWGAADEADQAGYPEVVREITFSIESESADPRPYFRNGYDGYAYLIYVPQNSSGSGQFTYYKLKLSDLSFTLSDPVTVEVPLCPLAGGFNSAIINDGKCFLRGYNSRYMYIVDLSNPLIVSEIDLGEGYWCENYKLSNFRNGIVKFTLTCNAASSQTYRYADALMYPDGWVVANAPYYEGIASSITNAHSAQTLITPSLMCYGRQYNSYYSYGHLVNNYLGTICNLASPITKTAAQSMKVVYTLTDLDD